MSEGIRGFSIEELESGGERPPSVGHGEDRPPKRHSPAHEPRLCPRNSASDAAARRAWTASSTKRGERNPAMNVPNQVTPNNPKRGSVNPSTQLFPMNLRNHKHAPLEKEVLYCRRPAPEKSTRHHVKLQIKKPSRPTPPRLNPC